MEIQTIDYLRFVLAFGLVIGLILTAAWMLRRFSPGFRHGPRFGSRTRLSIIETAQIDPRNRLVLVRCDDREHLLMVGPGPGSSLVVDSGIESPADHAAGTDRPEGDAEDKAPRLALAAGQQAHRGGTFAGIFRPRQGG